jgi:small-conductance mechanosensitive channel
MDLKGLNQNLERIASKGNFRLQTQSVSILLGEVRNYVNEIKEEKEKIAEKYTLQRIVRKRAETPEAEQERDEARKNLELIERIERNISQKEEALRQLEKEVQTLLTEIRKVN